MFGIVWFETTLTHTQVCGSTMCLLRHLVTQKHRYTQSQTHAHPTHIEVESHSTRWKIWWNGVALSGWLVHLLRIESTATILAKFCGWLNARHPMTTHSALSYIYIYWIVCSTHSMHACVELNMHRSCAHADYSIFVSYDIFKWYNSAVELHAMWRSLFGESHTSFFVSPMYFLRGILSLFVTCMCASFSVSWLSEKKTTDFPFAILLFGSSELYYADEI